MPEATAVAELARIRELAEGRPRGSVTILGGGIAGLVAAHELERLGWSVRLLEGRGRTQGRIRTHRFEDGSYGELGPMRIPVHHDMTRHYVGLCGLELRPFITANQNLDCFYDIAGRVTRMRNARRELYDAFDLSPQQREDEIPPKMLGRAISDVMEGLTDAERESLRAPHLASDRLRAIDALPMGEFLRQRCGEDAAELIGAATGLETMYDRTTVMLLRDALAGAGDGFHEIVGGLDRLPEAVTARLERTEIVLRAIVRAIHRRPDGRVEIAVEREGAVANEVADAVICTIPFSVLRQIDLGRSVDRAKHFAIRNLSYMSSTKVLLHARERFWETRDGIAGGGSQSDRVWRAAYYPCDNVATARAPAAAEARFNTMYGAYEGGRLEPADPAVSAGPGVLLGSYTWGQDARRIGALPFAERRDLIVRELSRIHPQVAEDGMVDGHASMFWDTDRFCAGSFAEPGPGDHTHLYADAIRPEGRLHFAGEHCSTDAGWMQGAIASALRAVGEVVQAGSLPD